METFSKSAPAAAEAETSMKAPAAASLEIPAPVTGAAAVMHSLHKSLGDMQIRSQVEETIQSMLWDIEQCSSVEQELNQHVSNVELSQLYKASQSALNETKLLEQDRRSQNLSIADAFVEELWDLSKELGKLQEWRRQHQEQVDGYDELMAKLMQAEEELHAHPSVNASISKDEDSKKGIRTVTGSVVDSSEEKVEGIDDSAELQTKSISSEAAKKDDNVSTDTKTELEASHSTPCTVKDAGTVAKLSIVSQEDNAPEGHGDDLSKDKNREDAKTDDAVPQDSTGSMTVDPKTGETTGREAVRTSEPQHTAKQVHEDKEPPPVMLLDDEDDVNLDTIEDKILMEIFGFLDAIDIVNTAQVNITLYSRVDTLFGMTGASSGSQETQKQKTPPKAAEKTSTAAATSNREATIVDIPPAASTSKTKPSPKGGQSEKTNAPVRQGLFGILQQRKVDGKKQAETKTVQASPSSTDAKTESTGWNAAMAASMTAKLTPTEIGVIISMQEKLQVIQKDLAKLTRENSDLEASLDGTEAVKDFLISKMRETEQALKRSQEEGTKVTQQIASDQEVIGFLDGRVQELERNNKILEQQKKEALEQLEQIQKQSEQKVRVLSDMLQFEREQLAENEREWRATKKLLVKEIKHGRAQIMAMQAEQVGFLEQNEKLKSAVMTISHANGLR